MLKNPFSIFISNFKLFRKSPSGQLILKISITLISIIGQLLVLFLTWLVSLNYINAISFEQRVFWMVIDLFLLLAEIIIAFITIRFIKHVYSRFLNNER